MPVMMDCRNHFIGKKQKQTKIIDLRRYIYLVIWNVLILKAHVIQLKKKREKTEKNIKSNFSVIREKSKSFKY